MFTFEPIESNDFIIKALNFELKDRAKVLKFGNSNNNSDNFYVYWAELEYDGVLLYPSLTMHKQLEHGIDDIVGSFIKTSDNFSNYIEDRNIEKLSVLIHSCIKTKETYVSQKENFDCERDLDIHELWNYIYKVKGFRTKEACMKSIYTECIDNFLSHSYHKKALIAETP